MRLTERLLEYPESCRSQGRGGLAERTEPCWTRPHFLVKAMATQKLVATSTSSAESVHSEV